MREAVRETMDLDFIPGSEAGSPQKVLSRDYAAPCQGREGFRKTHLVGVRRRDWTGQVRWGALTRGCLESSDR